MDLTLDIDDYKLNIRAGAVIIKNNKVLFHKRDSKNHYNIIGGRVEIGHSSEETVIREVKEEIGKDIKVVGYIGTLENFFTMNEKKYHEIYFLQKCEFIDNENINTNDIYENIEGKDLKYYWVDIEELDNYEILPNELKEILKSEEFPIHKIIKKY